ncbi:MAG: DUF2971 domain-containing protein [Lentisphaerae bacterium]|nr:DUF2971 domain-containing protein [Lentisphaerota bacterium]
MKYWWRKMFYYRYRSGSELSIKELIYDELYFASRAECNDPYEGKIFAIFEKNEDAWNDLIRLALRNNAIVNKSTEYLIEKIVSFCVDKSPVLFEHFINISEEELFAIAKNEFEKIILKLMLAVVKQYILLYMPEERYFASFSRKRDINLMWAHYANNHRGFCLIFRPVDGKIKQSKLWKQTQIVYSTPNSFSPQMSFAIPESFKIKDVEYLTEPKYFDGFNYFPRLAIENAFTEDQKKEIANSREKIYLQKHSTWKYEEESRIILQSGIPWLAGEQLSLSPHQRLFHYDSIHLAGIVVGVNMPQEQRFRIEEIMAEKAKRQYESLEKEFIVSDLVLFEEKLSKTNRKPKVVACKIYGSKTTIDRKDKDFSYRFKRWEEGYAVKYTDRIEEIRLV